MTEPEHWITAEAVAYLGASAGSGRKTLSRLGRGALVSREPGRAGTC